MNPELEFFQPWMAAVGLCVLGVAIIHKRFFFQSAKGGSALRQLLLPAFIHFLPASVALLFVVAVALRVLAEAGMPASALVAQGVMLAGVFLLAEVLLHTELRALSKEPSK
ncbi:MAG: hypothetical protein E6R07_14990 [Nevskiaceae bacterium]|nr:MAG: hypothetical protein E6R07_14990 [Nevskiaceae bacterium]